MLQRSSLKIYAFKFQYFNFESRRFLERFPAERRKLLTEYQELQLRNPFMFGKVMLDSKNCEGLLESLLNEKIEIANQPQREKFMTSRKNFHFEAGTTIA